MKLQLSLICTIVLCNSATCQADIFRWDNGELIPGTEGVEPAPGVQWDDWQLEYADLSAASLSNADLRYANLSRAILIGADLSSANLLSANLAGADLSNAILLNVDLVYAELYGANLSESSLWPGSFYGTRSYRENILQFIKLRFLDLSGWDFSQQDLSNADLEGSTLVNADLSGANLANATLKDVTLTGVTVNETTTYNQWTVFPDGFDPAEAGLTFVEGEFIGDVNFNHRFDKGDLALLQARILGTSDSRIDDAVFDVNGDTLVDQDDVRYWIREIKQSYIGDSNLDGVFDSSDFVTTFSAGRYETGEYADWSAGDWDFDGDFDSSDLVAAFADGGYLQGPRVPVNAVPEPSSAVLLLIGLLALCRCSRSVYCRNCNSRL